MNPDAPSFGDNRGMGEVTPSRRRRFRAPRVRGLLATSGALAVAVTFAVLSAGATFAYLNSNAPVGQSGTISSGTSGLNLQYASGTPASSITIPASVFQNMLPGDFVGVQVNVINVGNVPQTIGASVSAITAGGWQTRIATGTCPTTLMTTTALTTTSVGAIPLALGATQAVCLQISLPANAAAATENTSLVYTVNFAGTQSPT